MSDATILIIGRRRSGKSVLLRDIFYHHQEIPQAIVFSSSESASPFFSKFIPDSFIYSKYAPDKVKRVINRQAIILKESKKKGIGNEGKTAKNNVSIVLDDMMHEANVWSKDETIKDIFFNGRHYNIFFILSLQYSMGITPGLRGNLDYVFVFNEPSKKNRIKIYEDYASIFPDFKIFCNVLEQCTTDFGCLVLKTTVPFTVSWYRADMHEDFKVGKNTMWEYHKKNYNKSHDSNDTLNQKELLELQKKYKNTKNLKVVVNKLTGKLKDIRE
jgi:hypothetical protein